MGPHSHALLRQAFAVTPQRAGLSRTTWMRIPMKSAGCSDAKAATGSDLKPATVLR
jgi:hypothetical protein